MDAVRFGVVGVGGMGASHVRAVLENEECELVAGADVVEETREKFKSEKGVDCYESYKELIARDDIQAVCIVTPHPSHKEITIDALRAGKHALVEKPMSSNVKDADAMIRCARESGLKLGVVFQNRFNPVMREAKRLIEAGELGDLLRTYMLARHLRTDSYFDRSGGWRGTWAGEHGGLLLNQAPHALDIFVWLGGMPARVYGMASTRMHEIQTEDEVSAVLEYPGGSQGAFQGNTLEGPDSMQFEIVGTRGRLVFDSKRMRLEKPSIPFDDFISESTTNMDNQEYHSQVLEFDHSAPHKETIRDFACAIIEDREPAVPGEEGLKSLELANAIILSSEREKLVALPVDRDEYSTLLEEKIALHSR